MWKCTIIDGENGRHHFCNEDGLSNIDWLTALKWAEKMSNIVSEYVNHGSEDCAVPTEILALGWVEPVASPNAQRQTTIGRN